MDDVITSNNDQHIISTATATTSSVNRLCFDPSVFDNDDFNANVFVDNQLAITQSSLTTLMDDLRYYADTLRGELVDLLNRDYKDFISLSSNLVGVNEYMNNIAVQINTLLNEYVRVNKNVCATVQAVETRLGERRANREKYDCLNTLNDVIQSTRLVKRLLVGGSDADDDVIKRVLPSPTSSVDHVNGELLDVSATHLLLGAIENERNDRVSDDRCLLNDAVMLERVARQLGRLSVLVERVREFELVKQVQEDIAVVNGQFESKLRQVLLRALDTNHEMVVCICLRSFNVCDKVKLAYEVVGADFVRPIVRSVVNTESFSRLSLNGNTDEGWSLASVYDELLSRIRERCSSLLRYERLVNGDARSVFQFDFVSNAVWTEVYRALIGCGQYIFRVGIADVFHNNYLTSLKLLDSIGGFCDGDSVQRELFEAHPSYTDFLSRWNLPIYFQLRFQQIGDAIERVLLANEGASPLAYDTDKHKCSAELERVLQRAEWTCDLPSVNFHASFIVCRMTLLCWCNLVFLQPLAQRFLKLCVQILKRYNAWVRDGLSLDGSNQGATAWRNVDTLGVLTQVMCDVEFVCHFSAGDLLSTIVSVTGTESGAVENVFKGVLASLRDIQPCIQQRVSKMILGKCSPALQEVKRIKNMYRMTGRAAPTQACPYVESILEPLVQSVKTYEQQWGTTFVDGVQVAVVTAIATQFGSHANALLEDVSKTDSSLSTLKRFQSKTISDNNAKSLSEQKVVSDSDKIRAQLRLDILAFVDRVRQAGASERLIREVHATLSQHISIDDE